MNYRLLLKQIPLPIPGTSAAVLVDVGGESKNSLDFSSTLNYHN
jgi:hypothetical protein